MHSYMRARAGSGRRGNAQHPLSASSSYSQLLPAAPALHHLLLLIPHLVVPAVSSLVLQLPLSPSSPWPGGGDAGPGMPRRGHAVLPAGGGHDRGTCGPHMGWVTWGAGMRHNGCAPDPPSGTLPCTARDRLYVPTAIQSLHQLLHHPLVRCKPCNPGSRSSGIEL